MKQMIRNWREIESLGNLFFRDENGVIRIKSAVSFESGSSIFNGLENLCDKDGHKRFIEGNIEIEEITGVTQTYGRWSLSGSHLMIVIGLTIENGTSVTGRCANINLPDWIKNKIIPIYNTFVSYGAFLSLGTGADSTYSLSLHNENGNIFINYENKTAARNDNLRIQFDLLIDNE